MSEVEFDADQEIQYDGDHVKHSVGGTGGHIFRRFFHISMALIPWIYYVHGEAIGEMLSIEPIQFVSAVGISLLVFEMVRIRFGILIFGQREYEKNQISALAWGSLSISVTFVALHGWSGGIDVHEGWLTIPIVLCLTFGDPAMGEARRKGLDDRTVFAIGTIVCGVIWLGCGYFFGTPYWMAILMGPVTTAAEWPKLRWIDDNGTMVLIPLAVTILLAPFL